MSAELHVGDIGSEFRVQVKDEDGTIVDLTAASTLQLKWTKPGATVAVVKTAAGGSIQQPAKTALLGWLRYTTIAGDLDVRGEWKVQAYVVVGGWSGHTSQARFTVYPTL